MAEKKLTGKITRERIRLIETPFSPKDVIERLQGKLREAFIHVG
jgi:hypothetical protein